MTEQRTVLTGKHLMQGDMACAEGAIAAGCRFFAGYPITPATEIAERMARRMIEVGGIYVQMEDELASMAAIIGASWAGVKAMTATSGPGFSLMQENIGLAAMTETPCVVVNIMRGSPSTGQPTEPGQQDVMQAQWGSHGDYDVIALAPASVQEMFDLTIECFNLSETYRVPTFLLADGFIGHLWERVIIPPLEEIKVVKRKKPKVPPEKYIPFKPDDDLVPPMANFGDGYRVHVTGLTHDEHGYPRTDDPEVQFKLVQRLCEKIRKNAEKIIKIKELMLEDAEVAVIAYGIASRASISAVKKAREAGIKAGLLRLVTVWPFPEKIVSEIANQVKAIVVPEMNYGQLVREVERAAKETPVHFIPKLGGEPHKPDEIFEVIRRAVK
ncbi:2-oxoacid:acceptor oxidoreductase subunit alpha [Candidatus Bathyarchaeota archaeon]|nr:MAG: 2-oxoacid:acceptor oxidoreductase subunit alpha [Candidatus Bathyarchaeota archaeon]